MRWAQPVPGRAAGLVESPYRALVGPFVAYLDVLDRDWPADQEAPVDIVVLPEYVRAPLVGPAPLQPDRQAPQGGARRARATVIADVPYRRER